MAILFHGTTLHRAQRIVSSGPDLNFTEPGGQPADEFCMLLSTGRTDVVGSAEDYARRKAANFPGEGDKAGGAVNTAAEMSVSKAFEPPENGFVGIVDNLLQLCLGGAITIVWTGNGCRVGIRHGTVEETHDIALRKSVFRAILARIATLCNQHKPDSVSPYGGNGEIHVTTATFSAYLVNTTAEQSVQLKHLSTNGVGAAKDVRSTDVGSSAVLPPEQ
jgi:hypothetical protein